MDFYWIVTLIAAGLLIAGLVVFGLMVKNVDNSGTVSAVNPNVCPDYWSASADGSGCIVPTGAATGANQGKLPYVSVLSGYSTDSQGNKIIRFGDPVWKKSSNFFKTDVPAECTLTAWTTANHILWDGISNDLKCAPYNMKDGISKSTTKAP